MVAKGMVVVAMAVAWENKEGDQPPSREVMTHTMTRPRGGCRWWEVLAASQPGEGRPRRSTNPEADAGWEEAADVRR